MPDYRLVFDVTYRVAASSDGNAGQRVHGDLTASFPNAKFKHLSTTQGTSAAGLTLYDVRLGASGVVTAASVSASLGAATPPVTLSPSGATRQSSTLMASIDTRVEGEF